MRQTIPESSITGHETDSSSMEPNRLENAVRARIVPHPRHPAARAFISMCRLWQARQTARHRAR